MELQLVEYYMHDSNSFSATPLSLSLLQVSKEHEQTESEAFTDLINTLNSRGTFPTNIAELTLSECT